MLDGSAKSTSSITIDDADGIIIIDGNTTKQIPASDLKSYVGNSSLVDVALKADGDTLVNGFNYMADMSADGTDVFNLPASPTVGDVVRVKAPSDCSARIARISRQGSHLIDGEQSIDLVSPFAAVNLVYVVANLGEYSNLNFILELIKLSRDLSRLFSIYRVTSIKGEEYGI